MVNDDGLGFECVQILLKAETVSDLDECIRVINKSYPVLRDHLEIIEVNRRGRVDGKRVIL